MKKKESKEEKWMKIFLNNIFEKWDSFQGINNWINEIK